MGYKKYFGMGFIASTLALGIGLAYTPPKEVLKDLDKLESRIDYNNRIRVCRGILNNYTLNDCLTNRRTLTLLDVGYNLTDGLNDSELQEVVDFYFTRRQKLNFSQRIQADNVLELVIDEMVYRDEETLKDIYLTLTEEYGETYPLSRANFPNTRFISLLYIEDKDFVRERIAYAANSQEREPPEKFAFSLMGDWGEITYEKDSELIDGVIKKGENFNVKLVAVSLTKNKEILFELAKGHDRELKRAAYFRIKELKLNSSP